MRTLLWMGGSFLALCLVGGVYFISTAPPGRNPFAPDGIIAISREYAPQGHSGGSGLIVLRKNRRYEQWITDTKRGRVYLHTQKWTLGSESPMPGMFDADSITLHDPVDVAKVLKLGRTAGAKEVDLSTKPQEFFQEPTEADLREIAVLRQKVKPNG